MKKKKMKDQNSKTRRNDEKMEWRSYRDTRWTHSPYMPMGWEDKWAKLAFIVYLLFLYEQCSKATFLNITKCCFFYFVLFHFTVLAEGWKRSQALKRMNDKPQPEVFQTLSSITFPDAFWLLYINFNSFTPQTSKHDEPIIPISSGLFSRCQVKRHLGRFTTAVTGFRSSWSQCIEIWMHPLYGSRN